MGKWDRNADTAPIGRQPLFSRWTPSKGPSPWFGEIRGAERTAEAQVGGERFTVEQQYELATRGLSADTVETMTVKRQAKQGEEAFVPLGQLPPVFAFECPVLGRMRDGRVRVIAPGGPEKIVHADGWARRPRTRPWMGIGEGRW